MIQEKFKHKDAEYELRIVSDGESLYASVFKDGKMLDAPKNKVSIETINDAKNLPNGHSVDLVGVIIEESIRHIKESE
jgi:hypothetical protein